MCDSNHKYNCPRCKKSNFTHWGLPHPIILHWVLNPGLAVNELLLGQRLPKVQLVCKECDGAVVDRSYVPCPSCGVLHLGKLCSKGDGFGKWRGTSCPSCNESIPCLWNVFSIIILVITLPLWILPYCLIYKNRPLKPFYSGSVTKGDSCKPLKVKTCILMGASWGAIMWVITFLVPAIQEGDWSMAMADVPICSMGGLFFGVFMWFFLGRGECSDRENKT